VVSGAVWPFVCIVIMCGALSGFHALIASGTTPKDAVPGVRHSRDRYGAMVLEGFCGSDGAGGCMHAATRRLFAINVAQDTPAQRVSLCADGQDADGTRLGFESEGLPELERPDGREVGRTRRRRSHAAVGMANVILQIMKGLTGYWYHFVIMFRGVVHPHAP